MTTLTLEQVRDALQNDEGRDGFSYVNADGLIDYADARELADAIDAHLAKLSAPASEEETKSANDARVAYWSDCNAAGVAGTHSGAFDAALTDFFARRFGEGK